MPRSKPASTPMRQATLNDTRRTRSHHRQCRGLSAAGGADGPLVGQFALWPIGTFYKAYYGGIVGFEPWQLVTSAFMHGGTMHLALNMFALYMFGRDVEATLGSKRFAWLYGASVIAGSLAQLVVVTATIDNGVIPTVGASGGVFGVLLAFGVMFPKRRVMLLLPPIPMPAWVLVTGYARWNRERRVRLAAGRGAFRASRRHGRRGRGAADRGAHRRLG